MFGTVIIDAYKKEEIIEIADAINDLCDPNDNYGWASSGIYCFWDYYSEEVLYIGLASDLSGRFKQHNGILPMEETSCKIDQIEKYFKSKERLGYSIFVQSALSQPLVHRNKSKYEKFAKQMKSPVEDMLSNQGVEDIKMVEGILIESFRKRHKRFPLWNKVGGSLPGQKRAKEDNYNVVKSFCTRDEFNSNPIVSRSTLRELSNNPMYEAFENFLHSVRMYMLIHGMEYSNALKFTKKQDILGYYKSIKETGYDKKILVV